MLLWSYTTMVIRSQESHAWMTVYEVRGDAKKTHTRPDPQGWWLEVENEWKAYFFAYAIQAALKNSP